MLDADRSNAIFLRILDLSERLVLVLFFLALAVTLLSGPNVGVYAYVLLLAEGVTIAFVLLRRYTRQVTLRPLDWATAFAGTLLPLLVRPGGTPIGPANLWTALMVAGLMTSVAAKLSLRRSFGIAAANRGVKISGLYRFVRHPMYLGYLMIYAGFLLLNPTWRNVLVYAGAVACQILRIFAEERQLKSDPAYQSYMTDVRHRLVPGLF